MSAALLTRPISYLDFQKVFFTVGQAAGVKVNPSASIPAYLIELRLNNTLMSDHETKHKKKVYTSSAQLCANHEASDILGRNLLTVINFPRKQIGKMMSDCLITGVQNDSNIPEEKRMSTVFMTPSSPVELGSRVGLLAREEFLAENPRDLSWGEFFTLDLRIGAIIDCQALIPMTETINKVVFSIDLGKFGLKTCVAMLSSEISPESLLGRQVLVLTNLDESSKVELFGDAGLETVLCTIGGKVLLQPAIAVENGFKLA